MILKTFIESWGTIAILLYGQLVANEVKQKTPNTFNVESIKYKKELQ